MTISEMIANNARWLCKYNGINIGEMEKEIGVSVGYLSRVKGSVSFSIDTAYKIADILGVSMDDLTSPILAKQHRIAELKAELAELEKEEHQ